MAGAAGNEAIDSREGSITEDKRSDAMEEDDDEADDFDNEDFEEEAAFDDEDDASWKVRRCAAKALLALISTRSNGDLLEDGTLFARLPRSICTAMLACVYQSLHSTRLEPECLITCSGKKNPLYLLTIP